MKKSKRKKITLGAQYTEEMRLTNGQYLKGIHGK